MRQPTSFLLLVVLLSSVFLAFAPPQNKRSFVGKKLPYNYVDTEGHTINPRHYDGAVLVMYSGIPW